MKDGLNIKPWKILTYIILVLIFLAFAVCFVWIYPESLLKSGNGYEIVNKIRATNATIVGGIGAFVLIIVQIYRTNILKKQVDNQQVQIELQSKQVEEERRSNINSLTLDQYVKAVNQLKDKNIAVRLGGIYSLEQIMNSKNKEDEKYHNIIIELLAAYVREKQMAVNEDNTKDKEENKTKDDKEEIIELRTDIKAIITVLARRVKRDDEIKIDLTKTNFAKYNLSSMDLSSIDLSSMNLEFANLYGAHLEFADLTGADLTGAYLINAHLEFVHLINAHLEGAHLHGANLHGAYLINAHLEGVLLHGAHLEGAHLHGANLEFANLEGANFHDANLEGANLYGADLEFAHLHDAHLHGANLEFADLRKINLVPINEKREETDEDRIAFIKQLEKAKTVEGIKLDERFMEIFKKDYPDLLKRIETGEGEE